MHTLLLILAIAVTPAEIQTAAADRAQVEPIVSQSGHVIYFSTSHLAGEQRAKCEATLKFMAASASPQQIIERCTPVQVSDTLWRIDLRDAAWQWPHFAQVVKHYPYYGAHAYVFRADWFVVQVGDTTGSDAYYRLLLANANPSRDDFLKAFGVNHDPTYHFGVIVKSSSSIGPAVTGRRWVVNQPTNQRGSAWGTRDSEKIDQRSDPLEHLDNQFEHNAEEWLINIPKQSLATGQRGALMAYFLNNNKGQRQEEAPPNIVTDHLGFRGQSAIRNVGSCIGCHATGYLPPGTNELRQYIADGVDIYATPKELQEQIERFHLSDSGKQLARDNEDWVAGLAMTNGLDGETNAAAFRSVFAYYDADLTLATAAAEVHADVEELRLALAYASSGGVKLGARLSGLPHGHAISRAAWEQGGYHAAYQAIQTWRKKQ